MSLPLILSSLTSRLGLVMDRLEAHRRLSAQIRCERRHLRQLDPDQLKDIGVTSSAAQSEARRPRWDVPSHRQSELKAGTATPPTRENPLLMIRLG